MHLRPLVLVIALLVLAVLVGGRQAEAHAGMHGAAGHTTAAVEPVVTTAADRSPCGEVDCSTCCGSPCTMVGCPMYPAVALATIGQAQFGRDALDGSPIRRLSPALRPDAPFRPPRIR